MTFLVADGEGKRQSLLAHVLATHPSVAEALLYAAHRHTRTTEDAEDLFQETIALALCRKGPPDSEDIAAVRSFFGSVMNGCAINRRRRERRRPSVAYDEEAVPPRSDAAPDPERALLKNEADGRRRQFKAALRDRLAGEGLALRLFDWAEAGEGDSLELAKRVGCSVREIYGAQRRITYHARRLREQMPASERRAS